jgi:hypothetical protein
MKFSHWLWLPLVVVALKLPVLPVLPVLPQVTESHQSSKKDTSGTAKAIVASFNNLGLKFDVSQVGTGPGT